MENQKLSIITINYNNAEGLRKTMESVFAQTCRGFEYIVVDGASTDGSVEVIKEYEKSNLKLETINLQSFVWISEPDSGIYDAMNKGIEIASGKRIVNSFNRSELVEDKNQGSENEYVLMLNSGDYLVDEHVIERILPELDGTDIVQGNVIEDIANKRIRNRGYGRSDLSLIDALGGYILHQAAFIRKSVHEQYGYYDDSYKKNADTYFFITALAFGNATFRYVDIDIANFDMTGISNQPGSDWKRIGQEENKKWYGEHVSKRMMEFYQTAPTKIRLYDILHKRKFIWKLAMVLVRVSEWLSPIAPQISQEKIKEQ